MGIQKKHKTLTTPPLNGRHVASRLGTAAVSLQLPPCFEGSEFRGGTKLQDFHVHDVKLKGIKKASLIWDNMTTCTKTKCPKNMHFGCLKSLLGSMDILTQ